MQHYTNAEDLDRIIHDNKAVLLQFGSASCMPCTAIAAKLDAWGKHHPDVLTYYISVDEYPDLAAQRNVLSVPTAVLYINGMYALEETGHFSLEEFLVGGLT